MFEEGDATAVISDELAKKNSNLGTNVESGSQVDETEKQTKILELLDTIKNNPDKDKLRKIIQTLESQKKGGDSNLSEAEIGIIIAAAQTEITNIYLNKINEADEIHSLLDLRNETTLSRNQSYIDQTRTDELQKAITERLKAVQDQKAEDLLAELTEVNKEQGELATFMKKVDGAEQNELINPEGAEKVRVAIRTEMSKLT